MLQNIDPAPAPAPAPAAKNLNVTNFFATKQQVSPALSLNLMVLTLGISLVFGEKIQIQMEQMSPGQLDAILRRF